MRLATVFAIILAGAAQAEPPDSAIDWLSDIIDNPPNFVITPPSSGQRPHVDGGITITSLDLVSRDAAGLLPPDVTGFPVNLWGTATAQQVIDMLSSHQPNGVPALHGLFRQVLLAQADPPAGATLVISPLLVRLDRLFEIGALDEAETLIKLAGVTEPEIFRRWFEISLLGSRTNAVCKALTAAPALSDDIATRVICLARNGDWNAAAITLSLAASIGDLPRDQEEMLIRFLDPELFEGVNDPDIPEPLTPIGFFLREALGMPRPQTGLPLAYLNVDLGLRTPPRLRMAAGEKLVQSAAIPPTLLFAAYRGGRAASSGGIWGRAEAVQRLDRALVGDDDVELAEALEAAYIAFSDAGLLAALADEYADALAHHSPGPALEPVAPRIRRLLLLTGAPIAAWIGEDDVEAPAMELARILASNIPVIGLSPYDDPLLGAIHAAFAGLKPERSDIDALLTLAKNGQVGEVILTAASLLSSGSDGDPIDLHEGLFLLRQIGLETTARKIALQILLIQPETA